MTLHYEETESEVKVETMNDEPERIKCFPLYTILLALNRTQLDLLSLGCQGQELEILQTSKFDIFCFDLLMKRIFESLSGFVPKYLSVLSYLISKPERSLDKVVKKGPGALNNLKNALLLELYIQFSSCDWILLNYYFLFSFLFLVPWDRVSVEVISIHLVHFSHKIEYPIYASELIKYLEDLSYELVWNHERNFVFKKISSNGQQKIEWKV